MVPEAVGNITYPTDGNEYLGVRYTELVPLLIAGLQEATTRIEKLEALVAQLLNTTASGATSSSTAGVEPLA